MPGPNRAPQHDAETDANATHHRVILADSRWMTELDDSSVHLAVTSPPYWQLKDYGHQDQIGFDDSYEAYINNLNLVWSECARVLHPGCRLCVNVGDQFSRAVYYGRYKVIPIRTEIIKFCETAGFDFMGSIVWQKVTTTNTTGGGVVMGSFPYPRNGIVKIDYEHILLFKKYGEAPKPTAAQKAASRMTSEEWNTYFVGHWNFGGERQDKHLAMFPEEVPKRLIKMFTFAGETVLDPFLGSGTTALAARNLGRSSVGYEINEAYLETIRDKMGEEAFEVSCRKSNPDDREDRIKRMPYVFHDPVRIEKKADPRTLRFGSKIDGSEGAREDYLTVTNVAAGHLLELSDGSIVSLVGVLPSPVDDHAAQAYLRASTKGRKVYLRLDTDAPGGGEATPAYVYLQDRTFLNANLVRRGLMRASDSPHRLRDRFLKLGKLR